MPPVTIYTYREDETPDGLVLVFDVVLECGQRFDSVVLVHEPRSPNPGFEISTGNGIIGMNGLTRVIEMVQEYHREHNIQGEDK